MFRNWLFDVPEKGALLTFLFSLFSFSGARHLQNFIPLAFFLIIGILIWHLAYYHISHITSAFLYQPVIQSSNHHKITMEDPIRVPLQEEGNGANAPPVTADMIGERAAAIAEVATNVAIDPTSIAQRNNLNREGARGGTRRNEAADEALQAGDMLNIDGPGSEVQNMFIEFLFGL